MHYLDEHEQPVAENDYPAGSLAAAGALAAVDARQSHDGPADALSPAPEAVDAAGDIETAEPPAVTQAGASQPTNVPVPGATALLTALWPVEAPRPPVRHAATVDPAHFDTGLPRDLTDELVGDGELAAAGVDVYFACAEYATPANRTAVNAVCASGFWMDFDCGEEQAAQGKGYADKADVYPELTRFSVDTGLREPTHIVDSGGGLHAYWIVNGPILRDEWMTHAAMLKALAQARGLRVDHCRTTDIASVLRVPGTLNHKYSPPRSVRLLQSAPSLLERDHLLQGIRDAHERLCTHEEARPSAEPCTGKAPASGALGDHAPTPPDMAKLAAALKVLDPDCDEATWKLECIAPLAREARVHEEVAEELHDLAVAWSSGQLRGVPSRAWTTPGHSNGLTGAEVFEKVWSRFLQDEYSGTPTTLGTIYHAAAEVEKVEMSGEGGSELQRAKANALRVLDHTLTRIREGDVGAAVEPESAAALAVLREHDRPEYLRVRTRLKRANRHVTLPEIDAAVKAELAKSDTAATHHGYASDVLEQLTVDGWRPIAFEGALCVVDRATRIWLRQDVDQLQRLVAERHDGKDNCKRSNDYRGIARARHVSGKRRQVLCGRPRWAGVPRWVLSHGRERGHAGTADRRPPAAGVGRRRAAQAGDADVRRLPARDVQVRSAPARSSSSHAGAGDLRRAPCWGSCTATRRRCCSTTRSAAQARAHWKPSSGTWSPRPS